MTHTRTAPRRSTRRAGLVGLAALAALAVGCTPPPPTPAPELPAGSQLAGTVSGWAAPGTDTCPVGHNSRRVLTLEVEAPEPSELVVDVCSVDTTAHGGAPARGGFLLRTDGGSLRGTATGVWGWGQKEVLTVELDVSVASGDLRGMNGSLELRAAVERFEPANAVEGELTALG
jgi:hypothetical protein